MPLAWLLLALSLMDRPLGSVASGSPAGATQAVAGPLTRCHYRDRPERRETLPHALREISGLAFSADGRLWAHDDESGRIYRLDPLTGAVLARWSLAGEPKDDYEGVAVVGQELWLQTSSGVLYRMPLPEAAGELRYTTVSTGLGRRCELEGLAWDRIGGVLLLPCKEPVANGHEGLVIFRWDPLAGRLGQPDRLTVDPKVLSRIAGVRRFAPSSVEVDDASGHLLVLSGRHHALLELDASGAAAGFRQLDARRHPQAEGLTLTPGGDLLISDEGGSGRATLATYTCHP